MRARLRRFLCAWFGFSLPNAYIIIWTDCNSVKFQIKYFFGHCTKCVCVLCRGYFGALFVWPERAVRNAEILKKKKHFFSSGCYVKLYIIVVVTSCAWMPSSSSRPSNNIKDNSISFFFLMRLLRVLFGILLRVYDMDNGNGIISLQSFFFLFYFWPVIDRLKMKKIFVDLHGSLFCLVIEITCI